MAIEVQCDGCFTTYRVKEERAGTKIRCKECGESILVADADDFGGAGAPRRSRSSKKPRGPRKQKKQQAGMNMPLVIGGGIAAFVVAFVLVFVAVKVLFKSGDEPGQVAGNAPTGENGGAVGAWKVTPDPSLSYQPMGDVNVSITIPDKSAADNAVYPATASDFVAVGSNFRPDDIREVWNLRTAKQVGSVHTDVGAEKGTLSPDGKHFAAIAKSRDKLLLFDVIADKQIAELPIKGGNVQPSLQFAGPNRLVRIRQGQPIEVWKVPSGELETSIDSPKYLQKDSLAVTGGGRFVALSGRDEAGKLDEIRIFDLDEGELAGVISLSNLGVKNNLTCTGLSFSADGRELAGVIRTYELGGKNWLVGWDMTNGQEVFQHEFDDTLAGKAVTGTNDSPSVRWFPSRDWLFLFGAFVFDRKAGGPIWRVPEDKERSGASATVISDDRVLVVSGPYKKKSIKTIVLPRGELTNAAAAVSSGGLAEDAGLPPLTKATVEGAKEIALKGAVSSWKVQPDSGGESESPYLEEPIPITAPASSMGSVMVSGGSNARAVVSLDRGDDKAVVECYDLTKSTKQGVFEIDFGCVALSLSREGTRLLTRKKGSEGRLDIWTIPDGKHVAGWRPYQAESEDDAKVTAARFIDSTHVVTLSSARQLVVWELPAARALYTIENVNPHGALESWEYTLAKAQRGVSDLLAGTRKQDESELVQERLNAGLPAISPGGKYLALVHDDQLALLDSLTGDVVGVLPIQGDLGASAFHPSGERLAVTLKRPSGGWFTSWNLDDGKVEHEFPLPTLGSWLHWCDDSHLLLDNSRLINTARQLIVWTYQSQNAIHAEQNPDGRHIAVLQNSAQSNQRSLAAIQLPDASAAAQVNQSVRQPEMVLEPGKEITLQYRLTAKPPKNAQFETAVKNRMEKYFAAAGISVATSQPLNVVIETTNKSTGRSMQFRPLGNAAGGAPPTTIPEQLVVCRISIQRRGEVVWNHESSFNNVKFGLTRLKPGETIQQHLLEKQWTAVETFFAKFEPPVHVFPPGAVNGIGQSALTADSN